MKIGILTYHAVSNFGAQLQALSTVAFLLKNGYDPIVINWYPEDLEDQFNTTVSASQLKVHSSFVKQYLPVTKLCRSEADIIKTLTLEGIEAVIIGSDAVLKYQTFLSRISVGKSGLRYIKSLSCESYPNPFWGNFANKLGHKIPIVMMSASSQNLPFKQIKYGLKRKMCNSLSTFNYISVRDTWTQDMVKYLTNGKIDPPVTPDPVFAFNYNVTITPGKEEIIRRFNLPDKYILLSFYKGLLGVSADWLDVFENEAAKHGFSCVAMCFPGGIGFQNNLQHKIFPPLCPLDWYALIKYSQGYIGHKMHPIVISLHNAIPFFSFDNYGIVEYKYKVKMKSSKIYHILNKSEMLENRCTATGRFSYKPPSPKLVLDRIINFKSEHCQNFSQRYLSEYLQMMKSITDIFDTESIRC